MPRLRPLLGRSALAALLPSLASAQGFSIDPNSVDLGEITFTIAGADPVNGLADPFTLTGAKTATPITEVPQSVSVVSAEDIDDTNAAKIDEALEETAGLQAAYFGYDSDTNWVYSRGFDATQTGVYLDGLPLTSFAFGSFYVDPFLVERIEVLRGPSSVLYGASNPGGVINYTTRLPGALDGTEIEVGADSEGRVWSSADHGGVTAGGLAYRLGVKTQDVGGHGAFEDGFEGILTGGAAYTFGNGGTLTVTGSYQNMDEDHVGGYWLPYEGTAVDAPWGHFDTYFNMGEPDVDEYERDQTLLTAIYRQDLGAWRLTSVSRYARAEIHEDSIIAFGYTTPPTADSAELLRYRFAHDSRPESLSTDLRLERDLVTGPVRHRLLLGLDARRYELDQVQASAFPATPLDVLDPDYGADQPLPTPYLDQTVTQTGIGLYAQDQLRFGQGWIATLNGRLDRVATEGTDEAAFGAEGVDRDDTEFTYRVGLAREFAGGLTPYVTAGSYFNPEIIDATTRGNDIGAETGDQIEAGLKFSPNESTLLTIAAFRIDRENIFQPNPVPTDPDAFVPLGAVRSQGIEVEAKGAVTPTLSYTASLTVLDVEITDDATEGLIGTTPRGVAEEFGSFSATWAPTAVQGLALTAGARFTGPSWADPDNTLEVPSRVVYDAGVEYGFGAGWSANLAVSNLTDERYVSSCQGAASCFYGEGRNVSLALRRSF